MRFFRQVVSSCAVAALLFPLAVNAEQLPKRGSYSGVYGWTITTGDTVPVGKDHAIWGGVSTGSFRNDAGAGFLHGAVVKCSYSGAWKKDTGTRNGGDCVAIDRDGDEVSFVWKCTECDAGKGEFRATDGTGKYSGIKAQGTFVQTNAGPADRPLVTGFSTWNGSWELP